MIQPLQGFINLFQKQEMKLLKQEMELFLLLTGLQSKNFFDKVWSIQFKDSETRNRKWNYFSRKFNYFTYLDKSYVISNLCSYALFVLVIYSISILLISNILCHLLYVVMTMSEPKASSWRHGLKKHNCFYLIYELVFLLSHSYLSLYYL